MEVTELFTKYGIETSIIALAVILLVGCFKVIFKKQIAKLDKSSCKTVYETMSIILSFGLMAAWIFARKAWFHIEGEDFSWKLLGIQGSCVWGAVKIVYPIYENYKLRDLVQVIGKAIVGLFVKKEKKPEAVELPEEKKNTTVVL